MTYDAASILPKDGYLFTGLGSCSSLDLSIDSTQAVFQRVGVSRHMLMSRNFAVSESQLIPQGQIEIGCAKAKPQSEEVDASLECKGTQYLRAILCSHRFQPVCP